MKKLRAMILIVIMLTYIGADAACYPKHTQNPSNAEKTRAINVVINNLIDIEDALADFLVIASVTEDADFYFYTLTGDMPALKLENNTECVQNLMKNYTKKKSPSDMSSLPGYVVAVNDTTIRDYPEKEVYVLWHNMADMDADEIKTNYFNYMDSISGIKITAIDLQEGWHRHGVKNNPDYAWHNMMRPDLTLQEYGYTQIPGSYYNYDRRKGTLTINEGRADANILVYARASKEDYLYIGGYMAPQSLYESSIGKKTIKGVSLGYNTINLEKTPTPRNVAWQLFSIDESLYDVNSNAFVVPVKNAEMVELYYSSEQGSGACDKNTKYNLTQDDEIVNRYAPKEAETAVESTLKEPAGASSKVGKEIVKHDEESKNTAEETEKKNGFLSFIVKLIGSIIVFILGIAGYLLTLLVPVMAIAMFVSETIRHNIIRWVMKSKIGPLVRKIVLLVVRFWAALNNKEKPEHVNLAETVDNVFLSHSSKDRILPENCIEKVMDELDRRSIKYWISDKKLKSGDRFGSEIKFAIQDCSVFVLFVSAQSLSSPDVKKEMALANKYKKKVLPIKIEDIDPMKDPEWEYWFMNCQIENGIANTTEIAGKFVDIVEENYNKLLTGKK